MVRRLSLLTLCFFCAIAAVVAAPKEHGRHRHSVAVIIGNKTYQGRIPEVAFAHRDAEAMKAYLVQVLGYRDGNIIDLRDATQAEFLSAFGNDRTHKGKLWRMIREGRSHVTVFYSGHGVPGLADKRGYLLPVNADPDTAEINGYPVDLLYRNLARLDAASVTVYLDACFSGDSSQGMLIRAASPVFVQATVPEADSSLTVLTAASADQVASWDEENRHGLFSYHLLQALHGRADEAPFGNGDGRVTMAETKDYLDEEMTYAARRRFGRVQNASAQGSEDAVLGEVPAGPVAVAAVTPGFAVSALDQSMFVSSARVNVRAGPGTDFEKVAALSRGAEVGVTGKVDGKNWFRVRLDDGGTGYIFGNLLQDAAEPPSGVEGLIHARTDGAPASLLVALGAVRDAQAQGMDISSFVRDRFAVVDLARQRRAGGPGVHHPVSVHTNALFSVQTTGLVDALSSAPASSADYLIVVDLGASAVTFKETGRRAVQSTYLPDPAQSNAGSALEGAIQSMRRDYQRAIKAGDRRKAVELQRAIRQARVGQAQLNTAISQPYEFAAVRKEAKRAHVVNYFVIDRKAQTYIRGQLSQSEVRSFTVPEGLDPGDTDPSRAQAARQTMDQMDVWGRSAAIVRIADIIKDIRTRASTARALPPLAQVQQDIRAAR